MKTWRTIIIDDEPFARIEMQRLLKDYEFIKIIAEADSVANAKKLIQEMSPDLLFLDIDLGKQLGFDLLESVPNNFVTIFVTAYNEYAIRAFEVNALDYLLKPISPERLKEALKRLGNPFKEEKSFHLKPFDKILLNQHNCSKFITVDSISYIEAKGDYSRICTSQMITGVIHHTIKKWVERLPVGIFYQVHRSFIVNIDHIEELVYKKNNLFDIKLKHLPGTIPVSKQFSKIIRERYRID